MNSYVPAATRFGIHSLLGLSLGFLFCSPSEASIQVLDLTTNGAAGAALDSGLSYVFSGVTLTASATSTIGTPEVNATSSSLGVNITGNGSDISDQIDAAFGEELTFTFTFGPSYMLKLLSIDLLGVGPTTPGDDAHVYINANPPVVLHTGVTGFNGTTDVWTPAGGIPLSSGDTIRFVAGTSFGIQTMTFQVVPEPVSLCVWIVGTAVCLCRRKSR